MLRISTVDLKKGLESDEYLKHKKSTWRQIGLKLREVKRELTKFTDQFFFVTMENQL